MLLPKLILASRYKPKTPVIMQKVRASGILKTLQGSGLDKVLDINSSVLCSIIWLNPLEDPVISMPPRIKFKKVYDVRLPSANKNPKKADITTKLESLSFKRAM